MGFEPMALRSRTVRASPCATPRYSYVITDSKNMQAILIFSEKYLFLSHHKRYRIYITKIKFLELKNIDKIGPEAIL